MVAFAFWRKEYPKHVFLISGYGLCEKLCYSGMTAILQTYLCLQLKLAIDVAGTIYHALDMIFYFSPLFIGTFIADSLIGRYWTVIVVSGIYVVGCLTLTVSSFGSSNLAGSLIAVVIIAICSGGVKPCISSFGPEQFPNSMSKAQQSFFSLHYVALNAGALLGMVITPQLKSVACFSNESCWVLAFGILAIFMVVALTLFMIGSPFYHRAPVVGGVVLKMLKAIGVATKRKFASVNNRRYVEHWLDRAVGPDISQQFVDDCKAVLRVCLLFLPLPFYGALYSQQGSRWTYQAQKMSSYIEILGWTIQPEQIQTANCFIVVVFVPIFDLAIYPLLERCNLLVKPLQRMVVGCFLAALSFVVIGLIQIAVQQQNDAIINGDQSTYRVRAYNLLDNGNHSLQITGARDENSSVVLGLYESHLFLIADDKENFIFTTQECPSQNISLHDQPLSPISSLFFLQGCGPPVLSRKAFTFPSEVEFLFQIQVAVVVVGQPSLFDNLYEISLLNNVDDVIISSQFSNSSSYLDYGYLESPYLRINKPGYYAIKIAALSNNGTIIFLSDRFLLKQGGVYTFFYQLLSSGSKVQLLIDKSPNAVSIFWQLIAYLFITWAEIMFSISGVSFAFSQAPASMKTTVQSAWLLTMAFGNIVAIIVINVQISDQAVEFFVCAVMMFVVTFVFAAMSRSYKYRHNSDNANTHASCSNQNSVATLLITNNSYSSASFVQHQQQLYNGNVRRATKTSDDFTAGQEIANNNNNQELFFEEQGEDEEEEEAERFPSAELSLTQSRVRWTSLTQF